MSTTNRYIGLDSLAASLGVSKPLIRCLVKERKIPFLIVAGRPRFNENDVAEALRAIARESQTKGGAA